MKLEQAARTATRRSASPNTHWQGPQLTVVVPTYNEGGNVAALVERLRATLDGIAWEVIFVDDNSPDRTSALVKKIGARDARVRCIRRVGRRGLAGASIEGMLASQAPFVAVMDGDLQHDEGLLPLMLDLMANQQIDVVVGSRYVAGANTNGFRRTRRAGSGFANLLANRLLGIQISDPMSGFFMIRREIVEEIAPRLSPEGFKILLDILTSSDRALRTCELPYDFRTRRQGVSKLDARIVFDFVGLLVAKATRDMVPPRFMTFALVGASGIAVHLVSLKTALVVFGSSFAAGQALATIAAMTSNFFLNNSLTYRDQRLRGGAALKGLLLFFAICSVGAVSNIGVANWLYANDPIWWVAGLAGSLVSAVWNYSVSKTIVWRAGD